MGSQREKDDRRPHCHMSSVLWCAVLLFACKAPALIGKVARSPSVTLDEDSPCPGTAAVERSLVQVCPPPDCKLQWHGSRVVASPQAQQPCLKVAVDALGVPHCLCRGS